MRTKSLLAVVVSCMIPFSGCSLCCTPYDHHYATTGGKHQRVDMVHGRVGSIFSDPNLMYGTAQTEQYQEEMMEEIPEEAIIEVGDSDEIYIPSSDDSEAVDNQVQLVGADDGEQSPPSASDIEID